jgi:hypothetical protein
MGRGRPEAGGDRASRHPVGIDKALLFLWLWRHPRSLSRPLARWAGKKYSPRRKYLLTKCDTIRYDINTNAFVDLDEGSRGLSFGAVIIAGRRVATLPSISVEKYSRIIDRSRAD